MSEEDQKSTESRKQIMKIELKVDEKLAGGEYANICMVTHSDSEFIIDSFFLQPGKPQAMMKGRLILSARNAKRLMFTLTEQIKRYEKIFGDVQVGTPGPPVSFIH